MKEKAKKSQPIETRNRKKRPNSEEQERGWRMWLPKIIGPVAWLLAKLAERLMARFGL